MDIASSQIDVHPALVMLGLVFQAQLATDLFHPRLNLLDMISAMIPFPHDNMEMRLASRLPGPDPLLQNLLRFFYELPMQIDRIRRHVIAVILSEYIL
jgi:hypothetical protein